MDLDTRGREAAAAVRTAAARDVDAPGALRQLEPVVRRRARLARTVVALTVVVVAGSVLAGVANLRTDTAPQPAEPTPTGRVTTPPALPGARAAMPLCLSDATSSVVPAWVELRPCPRSLQPGRRYASSMIGPLHVLPFSFVLPTGWRMNPLGGGAGVDLRRDGDDVGVTLLAFPDYRGDLRVSAARLATLVERDQAVEAEPAVRGSWHGERAWHVRLVPAAGAETSSDCRVGQRCLPLIDAAPMPHGDPPAVAILPDRTAELSFFKRGSDFVVVVWVWDVAPEDAAAARELTAVLASLRFGDLYS